MHDPNICILSPTVTNRIENDSATISIARQHAVHAKRVIVLPMLSVCRSVRPVPVFCLNERKYRHSFYNDLAGVVFESHRR